MNVFYSNKICEKKEYLRGDFILTIKENRHPEARVHRRSVETL